MIAKTSPVPRARYNLPASLILTQRELRQYRRWWSSCTTSKPTECGYLPTAIEYDDFQHWLKKQDSGYFSDVFDDIYDHIQPQKSPSEPTVASLCRHTVHPIVAGRPCKRCPVCTIDVYLNYMKVLTRTLQGANGRPLPLTGTPSEQQENLYLAWSQGKISTLQQVCKLEKLSAQEQLWSKKHPEHLNDDIQSATKALELYWFETVDCPRLEERKVKSKAVAFTDDTNFDSGRPTYYFLRSSPRYEPGKYTMDTESEKDEDTISEDSEDYSHARVIVLGGPEEESHPRNQSLLADSAREEDSFDELEFDDGDSDWEDVDSDEEDDESSDGSYISFEVEEECNYIVFSDD